MKRQSHTSIVVLLISITILLHTTLTRAHDEPGIAIITSVAQFLICNFGYIIYMGGDQVTLANSTFKRDTSNSHPSFYYDINESYICDLFNKLM